MIIDQLREIENLKEKQIALILRHAERESINNDEFGNEVSLTNNGLLNAEKLGNTLSLYKVNKIYTSPIRRCVQTALCIQKGLGNDIDVIITNQLGNPGFHIQDAILAGETYLKEGRFYAKY